MAQNTILIVEDDASLATSVAKVLRTEGYPVKIASDGNEGLREIQENGTRISLVLTDLRLPGMSGLALVARAKSLHPHLPVILVTAFGTAENAIEATRSGAFDYILKPFEMPELLELVDRALRQANLARETVHFARTQDSSGDVMIGNSRVMQELYKEIGRVAATSVNTLIRGETGAGKELVARALHQYSPRKDDAFIPVNCAAIPETLLESELFGHERGAFTGADLRRIGRFEQANGGTLFLDEVGDMPASIQAKLLRVLQDSAVQRLGGKELIPIDVRVICATHQPLEEMIQKRHFREDLFYRINTVELRVPPLRERPEDIPALIHYFVERQQADPAKPAPVFEEGAIQRLQNHPWPGNIRQLQNIVHKLVIQSQGYVISRDQVVAILTQPAGDHPASGLSARVQALLDGAQKGDEKNIHAQLISEAEAELLHQAIIRANSNIAQAARWLGISRLTLREKLKQHGLYLPK